MFKTFVNTFPSVTPATYDKIEKFYTLLVKWNKSHNLVQGSTLSPAQFEMRHLIDCWQLESFFSKEFPILDIGSGAGLPGILLSIAGFDVHLVEIDKNKAAFLKNCKALLGLNCQIQSLDAYSIHEKYSQVSSRAFSNLNDLLSIQNHVSRETKGVYLKGANYLLEVEIAKKTWQFDLEVTQSLTSIDGHILTVSNLRPIEHCFT